MISISSFSRFDASQIKGSEPKNNRGGNEDNLEAFEKKYSMFPSSTDATFKDSSNSVPVDSGNSVERMRNSEKSLIETAILDHQATLDHHKSVSNNISFRFMFADRIKYAENMIENYKNQIANITDQRADNSRADFVA